MKPKKQKRRNPIKVAMDKRYGSVNTNMRDKRARRKNDARNHWMHEWELELEDGYESLNKED